MNQSDIAVDAAVIVHLFDFCVDAGYVEVEVQMTLDTAVDDSVLSLMTPDDGNGNIQIFAQSSSNDDTAPSSQSLIYRGELTSDTTELVVCVTTPTATTIREKRLQFGYRLYGSGYPFITALDQSCTN